jgi:hypothetical protein
MRLLGVIVFALLACTGCCVPSMFSDRSDNSNPPI